MEDVILASVFTVIVVGGIIGALGAWYDWERTANSGIAAVVFGSLVGGVLVLIDLWNMALS